MVETGMTLDQSMRLTAVDLAIKLTLKDEALFAGGMIDYANRIYNFVKTGEVSASPLKE